MTERIEVERTIAAEPAAIFGVLTDPGGHVAIDSSGMLMSVGGERVGAVGDTFVVHMDREVLNDYPLGLYDVTVRIVTFDPDREIAWTPEGQLNLGHVYGYKLEPIKEGTRSPRTTTGPRSSRRGKTRASSRSFPRAHCAPPSASSPERSPPDDLGLRREEALAGALEGPAIRRTIGFRRPG